MPREGIRLLPPRTDLEVAEEIRRVLNPRDFPQSILTDGEMTNVKVPARKFILQDFIMEESINTINGYRGCGKSWLAMSIANEATWGGKVGPWGVPEPINALLVDGEMAFAMIQERFKLLNEGRDTTTKPRTLFFYPESYAYRIGLNRASILDVAWRDSIQQQCDLLKIGLLILDNLSSLAPGIDENVKMEFDVVNRWLLELRYAGVSTLMTHHTGKSGEQRGTSAHEDHLDVSTLLTLPSNYNLSQGCRFIWKADKDRAQVTGGARYLLHLVPDEIGRLQFVSSGVGLGVEGTKLSEAEALLHANPEMTYKEAEDIGISAKTFYRAKEILKNGLST